MKKSAISLVIFLIATLASAEFYISPEENKFSSRAQKFLDSGKKETRGFVIYFTDKNVYDQKGFEAAKAEVKLDEKTLKRRAKTFKRENDLILFSDLPVNGGYINRLGLEKIRAKSKWFNFVSAEISARDKTSWHGQGVQKDSQSF